MVEYSDFRLRIIEALKYSDRSHTFMVHYEMGKGWSLYLAELYKNLFEEFEVRTTQFETTTDSCGEWPWRRNSRLGKDKPD